MALGSLPAHHRRPEEAHSGRHYHTVFSSVRRSFVSTFPSPVGGHQAVIINVLSGAPRLPPVNFRVCVVDIRQLICHLSMTYRSSPKERLDVAGASHIPYLTY